ncbi:MAG: hypothetical protein Q9208_000762 [Pyrenodesmia sp. 3 TL-2023]
MADPISIIAGVISIATVVVQSSKALSKLIDNVKETPQEIRAVARDVHAFRSILSLKIALEETDVKNAVSRDTALVEMIGNLSHPLTNCEGALQSLMTKIQRGFDASEASTFRKSAQSLKWAMFAKTEIKDVRSRLEATKSTLNTALETITMLSSVRTMAAAQTTGRTNPSTDINLTIGFLTHETTNRDLGLEQSPNRILESEDGSPGLRQRLQQLQGPLLGNARESTALEALPIVRYLAEMSLELSSHSAQIQQLKAALERSRQTPDEESVQSEVATTIDVFFDCASSLPDGECNTPLEQVERAFIGSPNPYFETSSNFYPEIYTLDDRFNRRLFVHAMIQSQEDERTRKLFITYAQARRKWRRVVVSAAFRTGPTHPEFQCTLHGGLKFWPNVLPKSLLTTLNDLLSRLDLLASITHVSLPLMFEGESGELAADVDGVRAVEYHQEVELCNEGQMLQDIEDMNCAVFLESEVVVKSRISVSEFEIFVESQTCTERKAPFPSASRPGRNSFQEFCDDLRMLARLRGCQGVVQFVGVVLDDSRKHLRSYLYENVDYNIEQILCSAASLSLKLPWSVRETWARQLITAIGEVHKRGAVSGLIGLGNIQIRADGLLVLAHNIGSWIPTLHPGYKAPELRKSGREAFSSVGLGLPLGITTSKPDASASCATGKGKTNDLIDTVTSAEPIPSIPSVDGADKELLQSPNFRTDIFTRLTQIQLSCPPAMGEVPAYFQNMIRKCRSRDPKGRPSARQLLAMFPDEVRNGSAPPEITNITKMFPPLALGSGAYCDECGSLTNHDHYHCDICSNDDLNLCPSCVARGIHCYVPEHKLTRKGRKTDP